MATQTICDRCRRQVVDDGERWGDLALHRRIRPGANVPVASAGPVIDLCGPCQADLVEWFRQGSLR